MSDLMKRFGDVLDDETWNEVMIDETHKLLAEMVPAIRAFKYPFHCGDGTSLTFSLVECAGEYTGADGERVAFSFPDWIERAEALIAEATSDGR